MYELMMPNGFELFIDILWLMAVWTGVFSMFAVPLLIMCWLFGRNPAPSAVPNKAVWG